MSNYCFFVPDIGVTDSFETLKFDTDVNYYYSGPDDCPKAIMGLKKSYILDNNLWNPLPTDIVKMKHQIHTMRLTGKQSGFSLFGLLIRAPDSQPIGVWYSMLIVNMMVKMSQNNKVIVYTPDMDA